MITSIRPAFVDRLNVGRCDNFAQDGDIFANGFQVDGSCCDTGHRLFARFCRQGHQYLCGKHLYAFNGQARGQPPDQLGFTVISRAIIWARVSLKLDGSASTRRTTAGSLIFSSVMKNVCVSGLAPDILTLMLSWLGDRAFNSALGPRQIGDVIDKIHTNMLLSHNRL